MSSRAFLAGLVLLWAFGAAPAVADAPTVDGVKKQLEQLDGNAQLDDALRAQLKSHYEETLALLQRGDEWAAKVTEYERAAAEAPALLETVRAELSQPPPPPAIELEPDAPLTRVEQVLAEAQAEQEAARKRVEELKAEPKRRTERRAAISAEVARVKQTLEEVRDALAAAAPPDEPAQLTEARQALLEARQRALELEALAHQKEIASYDARTDVLPARLDRAQRRAQAADHKVTQLQERAAARRRLEAELAAKDAERATRELANLSPLLLELAEENEALAQRRSGPDGVAAQVAGAQKAAEYVTQQADEVRDNFKRVQRKVDAVGLGSAMALLLRNEYNALPDTNAYARTVRKLEPALADVQYELIVLQERRAAAGDIDRHIQELLGRIPPDRSDAERAQIEAEARTLLTARRDDHLDPLIKDYSKYFDELLAMQSASRRLIEETTAFRLYIEERILWVRSTDPLGRYMVADTARAAAWLLNPRAWFALAGNLLRQVTQGWTQTLFVGSVVVGLLALRRSVRARLDATADVVGRPTADTFLVTVQATVLTLVLSAPFPLLAAFGAWLLGPTRQSHEFTLSIGAGLRAVAIGGFCFEFMRQTVRRHGLGERHLGWPQSATTSFRTHLRWFMPLSLTVLFLMVALAVQAEHAWHNALGRLAFMAGHVAMAVFVYRVFRPAGPVLKAYTSRRRGGWLARTAPVWYPAIVAAPAALAVLAAAGYYYTGWQLQRSLHGSVLLVLGLVLLNGLLYRGLAVARARLALAQARARRAALAAERAESEAPPTEETLDIPGVDAQTRQLFRSLTALALVLGMLAVWAQALPALRMLDRVQIWPTFAVLDPAKPVAPPMGQPTPEPAAAAAANADGATQQDRQAAAPAATRPPLPGGQSQPAAGAESVGRVTLADAGLAFIVLLVTMAAVRNLPGLLEMLVLNRLPLDAGARYAVSTIVRYSLMIVGLTIGFAAIGIGWSTVQWLAAALTFGLAFGLQEIFANFVSGLIILAERPIRVGDTVTVGDIAGTVSRIRIRATTITDWDRKELIVPNKMFITDKLINWSLSDQTLRIRLPVGIAYGSDVKLAKDILLRLAREHPDVLDDPEPLALFMGFGDNSLNFELRVYIPAITYWWNVQDGLNYAIDDAFRKAGITIAFPQRDLHVYPTPELERLIRGSAPQPELQFRQQD